MKISSRPSFKTTFKNSWKPYLYWFGFVSCLLLASCTSKTPLTSPAPVDVRDTHSRTSTANSQFRGSENANKPGYYTVKPGDSLIRIGIDHNQNWRDISRWNNLSDANLIEVGQVLRVAPPEGSSNGNGNGNGSINSTSGESVAVSRPISNPSNNMEANTNTNGTKNQDDTSSVVSTNNNAPPPPTLTPQPPPTKPASPPVGGNAPAFIWPHGGSILATFNENKNSKGIDLAGKAGDPVIAAADGKVIYADSGLRGYGNLIILQHNGTFLSAYAHNRQLLVKETQMVKKGQKIAEMGNSDSDRVKLHFEIRKDGKPVDPSRYLPPR